MNQIELKEKESYRIQDPNDIVQVMLIEGAAEIFGEELLIKKQYEFPAHKPFSIFCWVPSRLNIQYKNQKEKPGYIFNEEEPNYDKMMHSILQINKILESLRGISSKQTDKIGPRLLVLGSHSSGKNTLCKTLINYSIVYGWKPIYIDLDPDFQQNEYPNTIRAEVQTCNKEIQTRLIYFFGYIYKDVIREQSKKLLFDKLTDELSFQIEKKIQGDLQRAQLEKQIFLNQLEQIQDQKLCQYLYQKSQDDKDEKDIYSSGVFVNCPNFLGSHNIVMEQIKQYIDKFHITFVIVIDKPDIYRSLSERQDIIIHKMDKLKGVVDSENLKEFEQLNHKEFLISFTMPEAQLELFKLQIREDKQIIFEKQKQQNIVKLAIAVLHLKKSLLEDISQDQITKSILQSPLAFMAYIDNYSKGNGYLVLIPNENCKQILFNNVCVIGK